MNYHDVLNKWAEYSHYDPEQTSFLLGRSIDISKDYYVHDVNKKIETILSTYEPTGALAVIMAKITFENVMRDKKITMFDMLNHLDKYDADKTMSELFQSTIIKEAEKQYISSVETIIEKASLSKKIGIENDNDVKNELFRATGNVIKSFEKCNEDLFLKGGEIQQIKYFSTNIRIFETLAECLTTIEKSDDGLYLCYINTGGSADGYFGFFLKNNGNILSINDRVNEAYIGEHNHRRNGRWTDEKKDDIFPYDFIFDYTEHDYKGYATKYTINESCLNIFELDPKVYMPIVVAMVLINGKYVGKTLDLPLKYADSLLSVNFMQVSSMDDTVLIPIKNSSIVKLHQDIKLAFENEKVMDGSYAKEFNYPKDYKWDGLQEKGHFENESQKLVELWGKGFVFHPEELYRSDSILIADKSYKCEEAVAEFVGTEKRLRLQGYYKIREQLAEYMKENMYKAWYDFGKTEGIKAWYESRLKENMDNLEKMMISHYLGLKDGTAENVNCNWRSRDDNIHLDMCYEETNYPSGYYGSILILNDTIGDRYRGIYACPCTGTRCSIFFEFKPKDYTALEELTNGELPDIIKYWVNNRSHAGNPNLSVTDHVARIGTPVEQNMEWWMRKVKKEFNTEFNFIFALGYSKRGFNKMLKRYRDENK